MKFSERLDKREYTLFLSGIVGFIIALVFAMTIFRPMFILKENPNFTLSITAQNEKNQVSNAAEVRIHQIDINGVPMDLSRVKYDNTWKMNNGILEYIGQNRPGGIVLNLRNVESVRVEFVRQDGSGFVKFSTNSEEKIVDTYGDHSAWKMDSWQLRTCTLDNYFINISKFIIQVIVWSLFCYLILMFFVIRVSIKSLAVGIMKRVNHYNKSLLIFILIYITLFLSGIIFNNNALIGIAFILVYLTLFYFLIYLLLKHSNSIELLKSISNREICICIAMAISVLALIYSILIQERYIYYWDYAGYWKIALSQGKMLVESPMATIKWMYSDLSNSEYNSLIPTLIAFPLKLLGGGHLAYILVLVTMFLIPTSVIYALILKQFIQENNYMNVKFYWLFAGFLLFSGLYLPTLNGYVDSFGVFMISICLLFTYNFDFEKWNLKKCILLSILLVLFVIFRRRFAYWIVAYAISLFLFMVFNMIVSKNKWKQIFRGYMSNLTCIGTISVLLLITLFPTWLYRVLFNKTMVAYQAWTIQSTLLEKISSFLTYYGIYSLIIICTCIYMFIKCKNNKIYNFNLICIIIMLALQLRYLGINKGIIHNFYYTAGQIALLFMLSIIWLLSNIKQQHTRNLLCFAICVSHIIYFMISLSILPAFGLEKSLLNGYIYSIKMRSNMNDMERLVQIMSELMHNDKSMYIVPASYEYGDEIIRNLCLQEGKYEVCNNLKYSRNVDLRDGFPVEFLLSDIVVTTEPNLYSVSEKYERTVEILSNYVKKTQHDNFMLVKECNIKDSKGNPLIIQFYEKKRDFSQKDIEYLREQFNDYYAQYSDLFNDRFDDYLAGIIYNYPYSV